MNDNLDDNIEDNEIQELIERFERSINSSQIDSAYFDTEELDMIIEHYLFDAEDTDMATKAWELASHLYPNNTEIALKIAKIQFIAGNYEQTVATLNSLPSVYGDYYGIWGEALAHTGRTAEADLMFREYVFACDISLIRSIYADIINIFLTTYSSEDIALRWIDEANELFPNDAQFIEAKAFHYQISNNYAKAIELYNKSLDIEPYNHLAWSMLAIMYEKANKPNKALEAYDFAIGLNPNDLNAIENKALLLFNLNRYEDAKELYLHYISIRPDYAPPLYLYAECCENLDDFNTAKNYYQMGLENNGDEIQGYQGLSRCSAKLEDLESALDYAQKALEIDSADFFTLLLMGQIYNNLEVENNYEIALHYYFRAQHEEPDNVEVNIHIGNIYIMHSQYKDATPFYESAYNIDPTHPTVPTFLSVCYYAENQIEKFNEIFSIAKDLDPLAEETLKSIFPKFNNK